MSIIKLQNEGETLTMDVAGCEQVEGQFGEQVKFTAENGDVLYLPKTSADNQLDRLNLSYAECIGNRLTFSRDKNKKAGAKPYWGINVAGPHKAPSPRVTSPYADGAKPQPFDEPTRAEVGMSGPPNAPLHGEEDDEPTPLTAKSEGERIQREALERTYFALWARCAAYQARVGAADRVPVDGSSVNAMAATIWVAFDKQGLLRGIASSALQDAAEAVQ